MDSDTERRVIRDVLSGDRERFAALVDAYKTPVFNLAFRMTGSYADAEDLAQETFIRAFERLAYYDPERKFFTWLYTIALNLIRTHLRRRARSGALNTPQGHEREAAGPSQEGVDPGTLIIEQEAARRVTRAVLRLPAKYRELIVLRFYQGLSFEETAEVAGITSSASKMRVYRGLERLRALIEGK